ncbi:hypothetical protein [Lacrimispora sp.]|uniref:hypothetical protein n=1 Tax=Lacrimispora sp. TaxID=2719234 RepID=UPI00289836AD|nr:hypothetical protein [Lacrimispora sp.]
MKKGTVVCSNCGKVMNYVQGTKHKLSDGGLPEAVSVKEGEYLTWDESIKCPECGTKNIID